MYCVGSNLFFLFVCYISFFIVISSLFLYFVYLILHLMQSLDEIVRSINARVLQRLKDVSMQSLSLEDIKHQYDYVACYSNNDICYYPNRLEELICLIYLWNRYCEKVKLKNNPSDGFFMFYVIILILSNL